MQNFIQIPQKMKTGVQNVFKWEKCTLPFLLFTSSRDWKLYTISNIGSEALWGCTLLQRGKMRFGSCAGEVAFPLSLRTPLNVRFYEYQTKKYKKKPELLFQKRIPTALYVKFMCSVSDYAYYDNCLNILIKSHVST